MSYVVRKTYFVDSNMINLSDKKTIYISEAILNRYDRTFKRQLEGIGKMITKTGLISDIMRIFYYH